MKGDYRKWLMAALIICSIVIFIHGCTTIGGTVRYGKNDQSGYRHPPVSKKGPPAHAPAHGYRAKHRYKYYPSCSVYFDIGRSVYFYLEGDTSMWAATNHGLCHLTFSLSGLPKVEKIQRYTYYVSIPMAIARYVDPQIR